MKTVTPAQARALMAQGAVLVDVRNAAERAREYIPESRHLPLETLEASGLPWSAPQGVIFHCRSGNRTQLKASLIAACLRGQCADDDLFLLDGGLDAWKRAGQEVVFDRRQPIELQRQVQIGAGSMVLLGVALGAMVHPGFFALSGFVGAGLVLAGLTGFCGLARVLMKAPWNRRAASLSN